MNRHQPEKKEFLTKPLASGYFDPTPTGKCGRDRPRKPSGIRLLPMACWPTHAVICAMFSLLPLLLQLYLLTAPHQYRIGASDRGKSSHMFSAVLFQCRPSVRMADALLRTSFNTFVSLNSSASSRDELLLLLSKRVASPASNLPMKLEQVSYDTLMSSFF